MKATITITLLSLSITSHAQILGGFFNQQLTKDRATLQQIALQQTYLAELKKGYSVAQKGLNTAHDLKNGTFSLHQDYFNSLSAVSTAVKNDPKILLIKNYQREIITSFDNELNWEKQQAILASDEIKYIQSVYSNMLSGCSVDLDELNIVITPGKTQMKDAERIEHIDRIYTNTIDKYKFSQSFTHNSRAFALNRKSSTQESVVIKKLYNINQP
jgi:hypothetical protein